jgi:hypothetical protein
MRTRPQRQRLNADSNSNSNSNGNSNSNSKSNSKSKRKSNRKSNGDSNSNSTLVNRYRAKKGPVTKEQIGALYSKLEASDVTRVWKFGGVEARLGEVAELQVTPHHTYIQSHTHTNTHTHTHTYTCIRIHSITNPTTCTFTTIIITDIKTSPTGITVANTVVNASTATTTATTTKPAAMITSTTTTHT